jgi:phosphotransferase system HPr (HPr) family protein
MKASALKSAPAVCVIRDFSLSGQTSNYKLDKSEMRRLLFGASLAAHNVYGTGVDLYHKALSSLVATVIVKNHQGLHLRAASALVQVTKDFTSSITVIYGNQEVNARSVIQLILLRASYGAKLKIKVDGPDAAAALAAIRSIFEQRFNEE